MKNVKYFEVEFDDGYSICIKGVRKPTKKEATAFLAKDMEQLELEKVVRVLEIDYDEAHNFFDMEKEDSFPVFGAKIA